MWCAALRANNHIVIIGKGAAAFYAGYAGVFIQNKLPPEVSRELSRTIFKQYTSLNNKPQLTICKLLVSRLYIFGFFTYNI